MKTFSLLIYTIILVFFTIKYSGYQMGLDQFCIKIASERFSTTIKLLLILFIPCLIYHYLPDKGKFAGVLFVYLIPFVLFILFIYYAPNKYKQFLKENSFIVDHAIIKSKSSYKHYRYVRAKFNIDGSVYTKKFKISEDLREKKKIGDTILIKYLVECHSIYGSYEFFPTNEELQFYKGGKIVDPILPR